MAKLVTAYVELIPTMQGSESIIARQLTPAAGAAGDRGGAAAGGGIVAGLKKAVLPVAGIMAATFGIGAIVGWGGAQIEALANIERLNAQTSAAIASTGGVANVTQADIEGLAGSLEAMTAVEAEAIQSGANLLLTFTNVRNGVGEGNDIFNQAVTSLTDLSVAMGTDPQSAATMLGKALNDPIAGIAAMSRVGIQFTDDQKAMIETLVEAGDVMGAQRIILGELNTQFGGSGAAFAETYAGRVALIGHEWGTFGETIFGGVMPAMTVLAGGLLNVLQYLNQSGVAQAFGDALAGGLSGVGGVVESLTGALESGGFAGFLGELSTMRASLFETATTALPALLTGLVQGLPGVIAFFTGTFIPQVVSEVSTMVPLLVTTLTGLLPSIVAALSTLLSTGVPAIVAGIATLVPALIEVIVTAIPQLVSTVGALIPMLVTTVGTLVPQLVTTLVNLLPSLVMGAVTLFTGIVQGLVTIIPTVITTLVGLIPQLVTSLLTALPLILSSAITLFLQIVTGVLTALPQIITALVGILPTLVTTLVGMVPTILTTAIGLFLQLVTAIGTALPEILTALVGILPSLVEAVVSLIPVLLGAAIDLFLAIVQGVPPAIPEIVQAIIDMAPALGQAVLDMVPTLLDAGADLIGGIVDGLWSAAGDVGAALLQIGEDAVAGFLDFFGIQSPSRLMRDHAKWIPDGVAVGIDSGASDVQDAMDDLMRPLDTAMVATASVQASAFDVNPAAAAAYEGAAVGRSGPVVENHFHEVAGLAEPEVREYADQQTAFTIERLVG